MHISALCVWNVSVILLISILLCKKCFLYLFLIQKSYFFSSLIWFLLSMRIAGLSLLVIASLEVRLSLVKHSQPYRLTHGVTASHPLSKMIITPKVTIIFVLSNRYSFFFVLCCIVICSNIRRYGKYYWSLGIYPSYKNHDCLLVQCLLYYCI